MTPDTSTQSVFGLSLFDDAEADTFVDAADSVCIDPADTAVTVLTEQKVASFKDLMNRQPEDRVLRTFRWSEVVRESPGSTIECDIEGSDWGKN